MDETTTGDADVGSNVAIDFAEWNTVVGETATGETEVGDTVVGETATGDTETGDTATADKAVLGTAAGDTAAGGVDEVGEPQHLSTNQKVIQKIKYLHFSQK